MTDIESHARNLEEISRGMEAAGIGKSGMTTQQRFSLKTELAQAGLID